MISKRHWIEPHQHEAKGLLKRYLNKLTVVAEALRTYILAQTVIDLQYLTINRSAKDKEYKTGSG